MSLFSSSSFLPIISTPITRTPTPPWLTTSPKPLSPDHLPTLSSAADHELTAKLRGGRNRHEMKKIIQSIANLEEIHEEEQNPNPNPNPNLPWARAGEKRGLVFRREKKEREVTAAEREIGEEELRRLRAEARRKVGRWVRAKKAGVTMEVVDEIRRVWRREELAAVRIVEPLCRNMDRAHEIVEVTNVAS